MTNGRRGSLLCDVAPSTTIIYPSRINLTMMMMMMTILQIDGDENDDGDDGGDVFHVWLFG